MNVMLCQETMHIGSQCESAATQSELNTNSIGVNSPFLNEFSFYFHCAASGGPCADGTDFLDKLHFEHIVQPAE